MPAPTDTTTAHQMPEALMHEGSHNTLLLQSASVSTKDLAHLLLEAPKITSELTRKAFLKTMLPLTLEVEFLRSTALLQPGLCLLSMVPQMPDLLLQKSTVRLLS